MADQDLPYLDLTAYPPRTRTASEVEEDVSDHVSLRSAGSFSSQTNSEVGYFFSSFFLQPRSLSKSGGGRKFVFNVQPAMVVRAEEKKEQHLPL